MEELHRFRSQKAFWFATNYVSRMEYLAKPSPPQMVPVKVVSQKHGGSFSTLNHANGRLIYLLFRP